MLPDGIVRRLLWIDCTAGAVVGVAVLTLSGWLADVYGLPRGLLLVTGVANLAYASYSFSLARRRERPMAGLTLLAAANMAWAVPCLAWAWIYGPDATWLGLGHLLTEAVVVGGLGAVEWTQRERLRTAA
ncbi:MAG: hypothetical protein AAF791_08330 [Bacteroidota bacterium]